MYKDLAVVIMTCDKYRFLWDAWYYYFTKNFGYYDYPVYFCNESIDVDFPKITQIKVDIKDFGRWTERVHKSVEMVPHKDILLLLDDVFITNEINRIVDTLYELFLSNNMDALRILLKPSKATRVINSDISLNGTPIQKLKQTSKYLISYTPNIWNKNFLLKCTRKPMNIWESEVKGTKSLYLTKHKIYSFVYPGWYTAVTRQGKIVEGCENLINEAG